MGIWGRRWVQIVCELPSDQFVVPTNSAAVNKLANACSCAGAQISVGNTTRGKIVCLQSMYTLNFDYVDNASLLPKFSVYSPSPGIMRLFT